VQSIAIANYLKANNRKRRRVELQQKNSIAVIIPIFNEEETIPVTISQLTELDMALEIYVVDDGSTDHSLERIKKSNARVIVHPANLGQWAALRTGFSVALSNGAKTFVSIDGDGQHDPADLPKLVEPIIKNEADLVIGSRFLNETSPEMYVYRSLGIKIFNRILDMTANIKLTDCTSGYRAYSAELLRKTLPFLRENQFGALEFLMCVARNKARILEVPVKSKHNPKSKKGSLRYGYNLTRTIIKELFR